LTSPPLNNEERRGKTYFLPIKNTNVARITPSTKPFVKTYGIFIATPPF